VSQSDADFNSRSAGVAGREHLNVDLRIRETVVDSSGASSAVADVASASILRLAVLAAVMALVAVYVGPRLGDGWVPADDGILAQAAARVFAGQLPHRDFSEIYTGGLSVIHAAAFRVLGVSLMSLRYCVFVFFMAWLPAVYYIALRFTSAPAAGLVTLLAAAWSFPNYPAAMPSWYNLFFATFGAAALLRYLETRKARWLFVAGLCGGISVLIKVIGVYSIAAALLFLAFVESELHGVADSAQPSRPAISYRIFRSVALMSFLATVIFLFHTRLGNGELVNFIVPEAALVGLVLLRDTPLRSASSGARFRKLLALNTPFLAGVLAPIAISLVPYARSGSLHSCLSDITASIAERTAGLSVMRPLGLEKAPYALGLMGLLAAAAYLRAFQSKVVAACAGVGLAGMLYKPGQAIVSGVWCSVALFTPLVVLAGVAAVLSSSRKEGLSSIQRQRIVLLIALAGICSFTQYPFAAPIYLTYSIPLTLLAAVAVVSSVRKFAGTALLGSLIGFYLLFGLTTLIPDHIYELTHTVGMTSELQAERGRGLRVEFAPQWDGLIHFLQQHSSNGLMYAGNDCPELYFLSGLKNVTREDGGAPPTEVLKALQSPDLKLVVINEAPFFPDAHMGPEVRAAVARRFPEQRQIGIFHVFWRQ